MVPFTSLHCHRCGTPVAADVRFCPSCGQRQGTPEPEPGEDNPLLARVRAALLNEYDVAREIGRGGMAAVFLANDLRLPRRVALKVMLPELAYHSAMPQRFVAEARTAAMLDHPNIVPVFHAGEQDGLRYFAMRFIDGCSLEQLQGARGGLPVDLACHILSEVAAALAYAHAVGVVHRDVKPSNVMIDRAWARAIVTDFGIARIADGQRLTNTGLAIGTPEYMSPEQYSNDHLTGASDQYALGAVAYQLLLGRPPFRGTQAEVLIAHLREPPPALRTLRPEVPLAVETLVARMLAKEPEDRWPSLAELATRFAEHVHTPPALLRQELIGLVPARPTDDALSRTPDSPVPGVPAPDVPVPVGGASAAVPAAPPAPPHVDAPAPVPSASLSAMLDAAPRLKDTGITPRGVVAGAPVAVPALAPTALTPRDVIPIRPGADAPPVAEEPDEAAAEDDTADPLDDDDAEAPSAALAQHRAWLHTDAGSVPPPQPRRSLFVGLGALAAVIAAALLVMRGTGSAPPVVTASADTVRPVIQSAEPQQADDAGEVARPDSAALLAARDSAARADSIARLLAARSVVIDGAPRGRTLDLVVNDSVRLRARVVDGRRNAIADVRPVRWRSSAPAVVAVSSEGVVRALADSGEATITASIDTMQRTMRVRATRRPRAVGPNPDSVRPSEPAVVAPTPGEQANLAESLAALFKARDVEALRRYFDGAGGPSPDVLFDVVRKERDLEVRSLNAGPASVSGNGATLLVQFVLKWQRGGLSRTFGVKTDDAPAKLETRLTHRGGRWEIEAVRLAEPFRR